MLKATNNLYIGIVRKVKLLKSKANENNLVITDSHSTVTSIGSITAKIVFIILVLNNILINLFYWFDIN